ncbi:redoxin domain-containing protein [uncultured Roseovarius sp.]|uniref:redoxin domain-containing protein n=1 Tax=uncultured Roseovarius sp. TaxID=293344 RepID=UPI00261755C6|nr:redoxin domain-containing protein [uncultured Roseovarius sp.]
MGVQFFSPRGADGSAMRVPTAYKKSVKWIPQIGDIFPNFVADTTQGVLNLWDWSEGSWTFLFSHPAAHTPVCTTELGAIATTREDFEELNVKPLGLTGSPLEDQVDWHIEIEDFFNSEVWFPTACDPDGRLSTLFGMRHGREHATWPIRKSFILDPQMRIRMIFEYPLFIGRSMEETLRVVEALQLRDRTGAATPADWQDCDPIIIPDNRPEAAVMREFGAGSQYLMPYLRIVQGDAMRRARRAAAPTIVSSEQICLDLEGPQF